MLFFNKVLQKDGNKEVRNVAFNLQDVRKKRINVLLNLNKEESVEINSKQHFLFCNFINQIFSIIILCNFSSTILYIKDRKREINFSQNIFN